MSQLVPATGEPGLPMAQIDSVQPEYHVQQEQVTFRNGDVTLSGTLWLPQTQRPCIAVALAHGSGDDDRSGYEVFARYFAERGVASLIYDKRGVGASTGQWRDGAFTELAGDVVAAVHLLAQRPEIDARRVGMWGVSEGGWVAPLAATHSPETRFLVAISPPGMSPAAQEVYRRELAIHHASDSRVRRAWGVARLRAMLWIVRHAPRGALPGVAGYFARTMDYDPLPVWRALQTPVLLVFGASDESVPAQESATLIERALREGGADYTIHIVPGADHAIRLRDTTTQTRAFAPGYLDTVVAWMLAR